MIGESSITEREFVMGFIKNIITVVGVIDC